MNQSMQQLISIFSDIIKENNYATFCYSSLDDQWFFLAGKYGKRYDCVEAVESIETAYEKMLTECYYYWLNKNNLLSPDLTEEQIIQALTPEIREVLDRFMEPYIREASKILPCQ